MDTAGTRDKPEVVLNLWYICDDVGMIYYLLARCYVGTGTDEEKLTMLRRFASVDYLIAQPFPLPERFHTTFHLGDEDKKIAVVGRDSLDALGGIEVLFEDVFVALEKQLPGPTMLAIGSSPLLCITPLLLDEDNQLRPQTEIQRNVDGA